jgi:putative endonuclease
LQSETTGRFYIGCTSDLSRRLTEHNAGKTRSLRSARPVTLVYQEMYNTLGEARRRERDLKRMKSHIHLQSLIESSRKGG